MTDGPKLELMTPAKPLAAPRGPMITAQRIVDEFFTLEDGEKLVSVKWVRAKVPGKIRLGHSRVAWYRRDVEAWLESLKKAG